MANLDQAIGILNTILDAGHDDRISEEREERESIEMALKILYKQV